MLESFEKVWDVKQALATLQAELQKTNGFIPKIVLRPFVK